MDKCEHCGVMTAHRYQAFNLDRAKILWVCGACLKLEIKARLNNWRAK